jgi:hypothetical protein
MTDADIHAYPPGNRLRSALKSSVGLFKSFNLFSAPGRSGTDPRLLDPGTALRHYVVDEVVSHDDVVATYHGHSTSTGREVVIREFLPASHAARAGDLSIVPRADDDGGLFNTGLSRFITEGEIVRDLQSPNILQVLDVFAANRTAYVVTPRERGERLDARRARLGALQDRELVELATGVLNGFEQLHDAGIVHGQFNETSVVYSDAGVPIIQFSDGAGLATLRKRIKHAVRNGTGTRANMDEVRPSVDLYSLSQMLERLSRRPAGEGQTEDVMRTSDTHRPDVIAAIGRALSPDAEQRPDSAARWKMEFKQLQRQLSEPDAEAAPAEDLDPDNIAVGAVQSVVEVQADDVHDDSEQRTVPSLVGTPAVEQVEETTITQLPDAELPAAEERVAGEPVPVAEAQVAPVVPEEAITADASEKTEPVATLLIAERPPQLSLVDAVPSTLPANVAATEHTPAPSVPHGLQQMLAEREQMEQAHRRRIEELEAHLRERNALLERSALQLRQYDAAMKQSRLVFLQRDQREKALNARIEELQRRLAEYESAAASGTAREDSEQVLRRRIAELESQLAAQADALARSSEQLRQYETAMQRNSEAAAGRNEHEEFLRQRIEALETALAAQGGNEQRLAAERQTMSSALAEQRLLFEESQRQLQALPEQGTTLQHASQAQLLEMRRILAAEFSRNSALLEMSRQEAQAAEAARQRLVEQTELVLADYRTRNSKIRTHEEARILEERRLLEIERDYLRSALQTANVAREQAEQLARKANEQANRLRNLTTAQIASVEAAVSSDLKRIRSGAVPAALSHDTGVVEPEVNEALPPGSDGDADGEAKIA